MTRPPKPRPLVRLPAGLGDGPFDVWARDSSDNEWSVYRCRVEAVTRYDVTVKGTRESVGTGDGVGSAAT